MKEKKEKEKVDWEKVFKEVGQKYGEDIGEALRKVVHAIGEIDMGHKNIDEPCEGGTNFCPAPRINVIVDWGPKGGYTIMGAVHKGLVLELFGVSGVYEDFLRQLSENIHKSVINVSIAVAKSCFDLQELYAELYEEQEEGGKHEEKNNNSLPEPGYY